MPLKNMIQVSEFEKLYYDDNKPFKQTHWETLCHYLESVNKQEKKGVNYFRIIHKGIQFANYVGVIQAGNLTIEILPKIDKNDTIADNSSSNIVNESKQQWQLALLQMLNESNLLKISPVGFANLNLYNHSILDIYLQLFLEETECLLREGLIKNYSRNEGFQTALKGRIIFSKQISISSIHAEKFYVRHTVYNYTHVYNYILFKTLQLISHINSNNYLSDKAKQLLVDFPETTPATITADTFNQLSFDRKTERYRQVLLIAEMLLLNYRPNITGGLKNMLAILFDMNKLWEEWVYRQFKKEEIAFGITVHRQQSADFWKAEHLSRHKTIRPDIIIRKADKTIIVDTKWKMIENMTPDDADLKQMFVYNLYWNCNKSVLLYPANHTNIKEGSYEDFLKIKEVHSNCTILTVTIFKDNRLDKDFAKTVLSKII